MRKRVVSNTSSQAKVPSFLAPLHAALKKRTQAELIDLVLEIAGASRTKQRDLEARFGVEPVNEDVVADLPLAILQATAVRNQFVAGSQPTGLRTPTNRVKSTK